LRQVKRGRIASATTAAMPPTAVGPAPVAPTRGEAAGDAPTPAQQQADALLLLAEAALRHELDPGPPGERYQVVVHVDAPDP
jgi:hypothetical protein